MTRVRGAASVQCRPMMGTTRLPRRGLFPRLCDGSSDPAIAALLQLLESERDQAMAEDPALVDRVDPGRVWLLWFAIGATDEICKLVQRDVNGEGNEMFRQVVNLIFGNGARSAANPVMADKRLIDLFESSGTEAVRACMRGDSWLGYYLHALRIGACRDA